MNDRFKNFIATILIIGIDILTIFAIIKIVEAGSLNPSGAPAATMQSVQNIYDSLASTSFDSSSISGASDGSAIQVMKCIITKLQGGSCS
jgi:hypothetical protein